MIKIQNDVLDIFISTLTEKDVLVALISSFSYIFVEAVLPILPFLFLLGSGFYLIFFFREKINYLHLILIQIPFLILTTVFSGFSVAILLTYAGFVISIILSRKFEPVKSNFSAGMSIVSRYFHIVIIFIVIGLFLSSYLSFEKYKQQIMSGTFNMIKLVNPDIGNVQQEQVNNFVSQCTEGMKTSINDFYAAVPSPTRETCKPLYDSIISGIDSYKNEMIKQSANTTMSDEQMQEFLTQNFPIFEQTAKATPLFLAILAYTFLEILKFFISPVFGGINSLIQRRNNQKHILQSSKSG